MPLLYPTPSLGYYVTNEDSPAAGNTYGTTVTAAGSAHTKGSWVSLLGTISYDLCLLHTQITDSAESTFARLFLVDLGIGPDSSNVSVIVENLIGSCAGTLNNAGSGIMYEIPVRVPAGTQLWARSQASLASDTLDVAVQGYGGDDISGFPCGSYVRSLGANTGATNGVSYTPGNSGAVGSYAQVIASTAEDYIAIFGAYSNGDASQGATAGFAHLGLGAATEEDLGMVSWGYASTSETGGQFVRCLYRRVAAGTRVAIRGSCTGTSDTPITGIAYGVMP